MISGKQQLDLGWSESGVGMVCCVQQLNQSPATQTRAVLSRNTSQTWVVRLDKASRLLFIPSLWVWWWVRLFLTASDPEAVHYAILIKKANIIDEYKLFRLTDCWNERRNDQWTTLHGHWVLYAMKDGAWRMCLFLLWKMIKREDLKRRKKANKHQHWQLSTNI